MIRTDSTFKWALRQTAAFSLLAAIILTAGINTFANGNVRESGMATPTADIVDTAVAAGNFTTLAKALQAAGLIDALKGTGPFTVFAPTDTAFAKLPAGTLESLLKPENKEKLKKILLYHVVAGKVTAADVVKLDGKKVATLEGGTLQISTKHGVRVDNSDVTMTDIEASNGVIHVIDTVLMP